ncbi:MAG TPA: patatin-like phospholipase family protein [Fontimonas sp.]
MTPREILADCPLFTRLDPVALAALAEQAEMIEVPSGTTLIERGAVLEHLYIVAAGRLCAVLADGTVAGMIARLEPIGEVSALSSETATASVHAVRDSLLVRLPSRHLHQVVGQHPQALLQMTQVIIQRLRKNQRAQRLEHQRQVRCFAVIPGSPGVDAEMVAQQLRNSLSSYCSPAVLDAAAVDAALGPGASQTRLDDGEANRRVLEYLNRIEVEQKYLIYVASAECDPWMRRCMRQADRILVVIDAATPPVAGPVVDELRTCGARAPVDLVMIRSDGEGRGALSSWRDHVSARAHYYVRRHQADDFVSMARQLTGRGVGLVLGGGGARGFAHIGLMRALRELGIPVDVVGGSSMGAFFSALVACGYDHDEMLHIARETFVSRNLLNDYIFPSVALIRGRKFVNRLQVIFEDRRIEDLRKPFFCVSTNLTRGRPMIHDRGPLYLWVATSMAVPGVAPPVVYQGDLLCDGGVINNLPTDIMQGLDRGLIIASDVSTAGGIAAPGIDGPDPEGLFRLRAVVDRPRLLSIIFRTATLTSESGTAARAARADAYLRMPVDGVALFDWKKIDDIVERGYRHALQQLQPIKDKLLP